MKNQTRKNIDIKKEFSVSDWESILLNKNILKEKDKINFIKVCQIIFYSLDHKECSSVIAEKYNPIEYSRKNKKNFNIVIDRGCFLTIKERIYKYTSYKNYRMNNAAANLFCDFDYTGSRWFWFLLPNLEKALRNLNFISDSEYIKNYLSHKKDLEDRDLELRKDIQRKELNKKKDYYNPDIDINYNNKEGKKVSVVVNKFERDPKLRKLCLSIYGYNCAVCGFNFEKVYGEIGTNFIHVHHKIPLYERGEDSITDPKKDLIPICPNCHAMIHSSNEWLTVEELKIILNKSKK